MSTATTHDIIRDYIASEFLRGEAGALTNKTPLLELGIVDSIGIMKLLAFLESRFDVELGDEHLTAANFADVDSIARLIAAQQD